MCYNSGVGGKMVIVNKENCKGCGRCVAACPKKVLELGDEFNAMGIRTVRYKGEGCISCGICFYNCPEPYALKVEKGEKSKGQNS